MARQLHAKAAHVHALLAQGGNLFQRGNGIPGGDGIADLEQIPAVGHTGHAADQSLVDLIVHAGAGVQNRQRVTHGTIGQAADQLGSVGVEVDLLLFGHIAQTPGNVVGRDARKIIPLAAA